MTLLMLNCPAMRRWSWIGALTRFASVFDYTAEGLLLRVGGAGGGEGGCKLRGVGEGQGAGAVLRLSYWAETRPRLV